jgi:hypothetical protein
MQNYVSILKFEFFKLPRMENHQNKSFMSCDVQVCSPVMIFDGKDGGHADLYRWTRSGKGRALSLDSGTRDVG